MSDANDN